MAMKTISVADKQTLDAVNVTTTEVKSELTNSTYGLSAIKTAIDNSSSGGSGSLEKGLPVTNIAVNFFDDLEAYGVTWNDPENEVASTGAFVWASTKIYLTSDNKTFILMDEYDVKDKYATQPIYIKHGTTAMCFVTSSLTGEKSTTLVDVGVDWDSIPLAYGFHIDSSESDPSAAVTYLRDAVGMIPAAMGDTFSYGSWEDAFFMPKPCMVKYNGTLDYYLDPNDYTKKTNGTSSDVANTSYAGNAMMQWGAGGTIWMKVVPDSDDSTSGTVYISNTQVDSEYTCYPFINNQGVQVPYFYTPIYNGYLDGSNRLRSISGQTPLVSKSASDEITYAKANNPGSDVLWYTETFSERLLINMLLVLMSKSLDTQTAFGYGYANGNNAKINTGTMDTKGLFWGETTGKYGVKVFGMENWWGNIYRRIAGWTAASGVQKYKMTYGTQDGSTASAYNTDGSGYLTGPTLSSSGYIKQMTFSNKYGMMPSAVGGSTSTYYPDYFSGTTSAGPYYACVGGYWGGSLNAGAFYAMLTVTASYTYTYIGAAPSLKPPA